jgi:hypothetical protein
LFFYKANDCSESPGHDLDGEGATHTFISFAYTERTGVYMTVYYSTKIFGTHVRKDICAGCDNMWKESQRENSMKELDITNSH